MFGLDNKSGINVMPPIAPADSQTPLWFTEGGAGLSATYPGQDWFNQIQAELLNVLRAADIAPQKGNISQLSSAISKLASAYAVSIVHSTGQSLTSVMSQKTVTDEQNKKFDKTGGTVSGEVKTEKRFIVENSNGFSGIELIGLAGTVVIETDAAGSGYIVIRDKDGKNIGSVTLSTLTDVNSFIYPGKIEWCSLPLSEIRPHCYHANGDKYPLTSDVGKALRSLSQGYKAAHGIVESDGMINVPNVYHSDGRGYFFRANALGLKQEDISRRIYGAIGIEKGIELPTSYGAFTQNFVDIDSASHTGVSRSSKGTWNFDSSNVTPTGNENRPISYGLIPIVYLGV